MERFLVLFCALLCSKAQVLIYPDQYEKMAKPISYTNQESSKTWYNSPPVIAANPFNTIENEFPSLYDVFPRNWSDHVTKIISKGITKFALDMDDAIYKTRNNSIDGSKKKENIVFSPLSLAGTMAIVLLAAGGKTFDEVVKILGLESGVDVSRHSEVVHEMFGLLIGMVNNKSSSGPQATYANGIFIQEGYPIRSEFRVINQNVYKSEIINTDFHNHGEEARETVNTWVNNRTMGKISKILSSVPSPETDVIFASALYFNGEWDQYFIDSATMRKPFNIEPGQTIIVDMMYNGADFPFYEDKQLGVKILGLPYKGLQMIMYVLLPSKPGANALKEFETSLNPDILENLIHNIKNQTCIVGFPKMKLSSTLSLKRAFQSLGLVTLFDPVKADLSLLSPGLNKISNSGLSVNRERSRGASNSQINPQLLKPQDGFYFPPRIGQNIQENKTINSDLESRKHYFRYEDKLRGYSIEQWDNGYNIKRIIPRAKLERQRIEVAKHESSQVSNQQPQQQQQQQQQEKKKKNTTEKAEEEEENGKPERQNRPIDQDFLDFLNSQNLPSFGLDSLRNSANIENPGLYAEDVLHRVEININEKGTEAAAATAIALERTGSQNKFIANRPFLFFIRHELSKLIWFWGTVNSPTPNYPPLGT